MTAEITATLALDEALADLDSAADHLSHADHALLDGGHRSWSEEAAALARDARRLKRRSAALLRNIREGRL